MPVIIIVSNIGTMIMGVAEMAIRYKRFGNQEYAYEIWNEKDNTTKKRKQRSKYIGVVIDKEKGEYEKLNKTKQTARRTEQKEQEILDYGDSYFFNEFLRKDTILPILRAVFSEYTDRLLSLVLYKLQGGSAMRQAEYKWKQASFLRLRRKQKCRCIFVMLRVILAM